MIIKSLMNRISKSISPTIERRSVNFLNLMENMISQSPYVNDGGQRVAQLGYSANAICYMCINLVASAAKSVPLRVYKKQVRRGKTEYVEDQNHELNKFLNDPNFDFGGMRFQFMLHAYQLIGGDVYIIPRYGNPGNNPVGLPVNYDVVPSTRCSPEVQSGAVTAYIETTLGGGVIRHPVQIGNRRHPVIHLRDFNPVDEFNGMSPGIPAQSMIDVSNMSAAFNHSLLRNGSRLTMAVLLSETMDPSDIQNVKTDFINRLSGYENAGKPIFMNNVNDIKEMGMTPRDGEYQEVALHAARLIANCFGVPTFLLGLKDTQSTFNNMREAREFFFLTTIKNRLDYYYGDKDSYADGEVNRYLRRIYGDGHCIKPDWDSVDALSSVRDARIDRAQKLDGIATIETMARVAGYPIDRPVAGLTDVIWRNGSSMPITYASQLDDGLEAEIEPEKSDTADIEYKLINDFTPADRQEELRLFRNFSAIFERRFEKISEKLLNSAIDRAADAYQSGEDTDIAVNETQPGFEAKLSKHYRDVMKFFGARVIDSLEKSSVEVFETKTIRSLFAAAVDRFIRAYVADEVVKVSQTTKDDIKKAILRGEQEGKNRREIAKMISAVKGITGRRAKVIAQTETHAAANAGQTEAGIAATGGDFREWIAAEDARTRPTHSSADGKKVRDGELFNVGGYPARYPGDPKLPAKERINCRCSIGLIIDEEA